MGLLHQCLRLFARQPGQADLQFDFDAEAAGNRALFRYFLSHEILKI